MIVGQMSLCRFPYWGDMLDKLAAFCDEVIVRVQSGPGAKDPSQRCYSPNMNRFVSSTPYDQWRWREEMIRMLDDVKPDIVLSLDEDESFGNGFREDLAAFQESSLSHAMFKYEMRTDDGTKFDRIYPAAPHCKMFKWRPGLTYSPYKGYARPTNYVDAKPFVCKSKIEHWCFYNEELRDLRRDDFNKYIVGQKPQEQHRLMIGDGRPRPGWTTLDAFNLDADILTEIPPLPPEVTGKRWDVICGIHFIEHIHPWEAKELLGEIRSVLKPGGRLILEQPNLEVAARTILENCHREEKYNRFAMYPLFGEVKKGGNPMYQHKWGYTPDSLTAVLKQCGFGKIEVKPAKYHYPERDFRIEATV